MVVVYFAKSKGSAVQIWVHLWHLLLFLSSFYPSPLPHHPFSSFSQPSAGGVFVLENIKMEKNCSQNHARHV